MIENLKFIEELSWIDNILKDTGNPEFNIILAKGKIRELKSKYNQEIENFEKQYAPKENQ